MKAAAGVSEVQRASEVDMNSCLSNQQTSLMDEIVSLFGSEVSLFPVLGNSALSL